MGRKIMHRAKRHPSRITLGGWCAADDGDSLTRGVAGLPTGMRRSQWGQAEDSSRVLKKSSVSDHAAVDHDRRNAQGSLGSGASRYRRIDVLVLPVAGFLACARNDRVGHLATASKKLLQNFGATACEHAAVNFDPMVQLRVIQHLHH